MPFLLDLAKRALDSAVASVGTTVFGIAFGLLIGLLSTFLQLRNKGLARMRQHWQDNLKHFVLVTIIAWSILFGYHVFVITRQIDLTASKARLPQVVHKPGPPVFLEGTRTRREASAKAATLNQPVIMSLGKAGRFIEWRIQNTSSNVVQTVLYYYGLWDLDTPQANSSGPAVEMPVRRVDFINPGKSVGEVLNLPPGANRLFGVALLNCPGCKERGYWIYIEHGSVGWFAEINGYDQKGFAMPYSAVREEMEAMMKKVAPPPTRNVIK